MRYFDPVTGKSKQIRRRARNRDHARDVLKDLTRSAQQPQPSQSVSVADYLDMWAAETLPVSGVTESTMDQYRSIITTPLKPTLGKLALAKFTPREAERWVARLDKATTKARTPRPTKANPHPKPVPGRPISQSTKRTAYAVLSLALDVAVRDRLIDENPSEPRQAPEEGKYGRAGDDRGRG